MLTLIFIVMITELSFIQPWQNWQFSTASFRTGYARSCLKTAPSARVARDHSLSYFKRMMIKRPSSAQGGRLLNWARQMTAILNSSPAINMPDETNSLITWIGGLSAEQADVFAGELSEFCQSMNLDLDWMLETSVDPELFEQSANAEPERVFDQSLRDWEQPHTSVSNREKKFFSRSSIIQSGMLEMVALFALSFQRRQSLQAMVFLQDWQPKNRVVTQAIYLRLVEAGLVLTPASLMFASEQKRYAHMVQSIQNALARQHPALEALVSNLLADGILLER